MANYPKIGYNKYGLVYMQDNGSAKRIAEFFNNIPAVTKIETSPPQLDPVQNPIDNIGIQGLKTVAVSPEPNSVNRIKAGDIVHVAGNAMNLGLDALGFKDQNPTTKGEIIANGFNDLVNSGLKMSGDPVLTAIGYGRELARKIGIKADGSEGLSGSKDTLNNIASGSVIGGLFAKVVGRTDKANWDDNIDRSSAYQNVAKDATVRKSLQNGGKALLWGKKEVNEATKFTNNIVDVTTNIINKEKKLNEAAAQRIPYSGLHVRTALSGANRKLNIGIPMYSDGGALSIKEMALEDFNQILLEASPLRIGSTNTITPIYKEGGNLIASGALHARKHNILDSKSDLEGRITKKGIPVVSMEDGGKIKQQAEIESGELVFDVEVSKTLDELYDKWEKVGDESDKKAIELEVGKLLVVEILKNTTDKDKVKKGVIESLKEKIA